ncbi:MAG: DeoR/GlpR family DNA-binding transcription regulator [Lentisphaeria bacterium]|jgi:DeoR/GlpR family transcriptional regulator of sugar metabolism|nr:DeoR/GlpR family DNA-binding transcription regulator [Lentisphaeria bacterium]
MGKAKVTQSKILALLRQHGQLRIEVIASAVERTEVTVRRHLLEMEEAGKVLRLHGACRLADASQAQPYFFQQEAASMVCEKQAIGRQAAALLESHDRIFFDSGTTVLECGNALCQRLEKSELVDLSIVSNSLAFGASLAQHCPVLLLGGNMRSQRLDLAGPLALDNLLRYHFSKAVLGTDGIADDATLSATDDDTAQLAAAVLQQSQQVLILADSSKLGKHSFVPFGKINGEKFTLITDKNANPELLEQLQKNGVKLLLA